MENINKLIAAIAEKANLFKPKDSACYVSYEDKDGYIREFSDMGGTTFCESCISKAVKEAEEMELPEDFKEMTYEIETSVEREGFLTCENCGDIIRCSVIVDKQELEHWLSLEAFDVNNAQLCYELETLFYEGKMTYPDKCEEIAIKILQLIENGKENQNSIQ